jgi:hypothetical protein
MKDYVTIAFLVSELKQSGGVLLKGKATVNPNETALIPFINKRNLSLRLPTFFNERLNTSGEVKYLGLTLDRRLTWNQYVQNVTNKCKMALMVGHRTLGKTWGLKPQMVQWLYTAVVRPMIAYG